MLTYDTEILTIYAPMIYTAPCVMLLMRAAYFTRVSGRGLGPGNREFLGPVKWHLADRRVPFQKHKTCFLGEQDGLGTARPARRRQRFLLAPRKLNPVPGRDTPGKILNIVRIRACKY
jgi:hypothetical protein